MAEAVFGRAALAQAWKERLDRDFTKGFAVSISEPSSFVAPEETRSTSTAHGIQSDGALLPSASGVGARNEEGGGSLVSIGRAGGCLVPGAEPEGDVDSEGGGPITWTQPASSQIVLGRETSPTRQRAGARLA
jgi:hypothetical protein